MNILDNIENAILDMEAATDRGALSSATNEALLLVDHLIKAINDKRNALQPTIDKAEAIAFARRQVEQKQDALKVYLATAGVPHLLQDLLDAQDQLKKTSA